MTSFDAALLQAVIFAVIVAAIIAVVVAIYQHDKEQTLKTTRNRLTLAWVWDGLAEPEPWDDTRFGLPGDWAHGPTQCYPMVLELNDDFSEPDPADLPARSRFQFTTRAEAKETGKPKRQREPVTLNVALGGGYADMAVTV